MCVCVFLNLFPCTLLHNLAIRETSTRLLESMFVGKSPLSFVVLLLSLLIPVSESVDFVLHCFIKIIKSNYVILGKSAFLSESWWCGIHDQVIRLGIALKHPLIKYIIYGPIYLQRKGGQQKNSTGPGFSDVDRHEFKAAAYGQTCRSAAILIQTEERFYYEYTLFSNPNESGICL